MRRFVFLLLLVSPVPGQRFLADDPLQSEPRPRPVGELLTRKFSDYYDLFSNQFGERGKEQPKSGPPSASQAINTMGEPLESGWWQRRHYYKRMSIEQLTNGPGHRTPPSTAGKWTVLAVKAEGVTPGFTMIDSAKRRYFVKFDPMTNPEMATAADSISARFFYALGYWVPDNYIIFFKPEQLELKEGVELADAAGKRRKMTREDLVTILKKVPLTKDGLYRATASLAVEGKPIGPPRYFGTRTDDPNDIVPHEHRRDLRGLHVFCAWLDHDDSRAINNLDTVVTTDGVPAVRHYLLDFGSTLGSGTERPNSPRSGAYYFSWKNSARQLFTLGLAPPYWAFANFPNYPAIGRIEWKVFDPEKWVPEYPNVAFLNRLPDDEFWAAKQVMAFTDEEIKAIVGVGQYTDQKGADWLIECLRERRNKIGKIYFAKVLPLDRFRIEGASLAWDDLSKEHGMGGVADIKVSWSRFDNKASAKTALPGSTGNAVPDGAEYMAADLTSAARPKQAVTVYVRRNGGAISVVGLDRTW